MSTFNLKRDKGICSKKATTDISTKKPIIDPLLPKKACPQCKGSGAEELGRIIICRRCAGSGELVKESTVKMTSVASSMIRLAGDEVAGPSDDLFEEFTVDDETSDEPYLGSGTTGYENPVLPQGDEEQIRNDISWILSSCQPVVVEKVFRWLATKMNIPEADQTAITAGEDGHADSLKMTEAIVRQADTMTGKDLRDLFMVVRKSE